MLASCNVAAPRHSLEQCQSMALKSPCCTITRLKSCSSTFIYSSTHCKHAQLLAIISTGIPRFAAQSQRKAAHLPPDSHGSRVIEAAPQDGHLEKNGPSHHMRAHAGKAHSHGSEAAVAKQQLHGLVGAPGDGSCRHMEEHARS